MQRPCTCGSLGPRHRSESVGGKKTQSTSLGQHCGSRTGLTMRALPRTTCTTGSSIAKRVQADAAILPAGGLAALCGPCTRQRILLSVLFRLYGQSVNSSITTVCAPSWFVTPLFQSTLYCLPSAPVPLISISYPYQESCSLLQSVTRSRVTVERALEKRAPRARRAAAARSIELTRRRTRLSRTWTGVR